LGMKNAPPPAIPARRCLRRKPEGRLPGLGGAHTIARILSL
jgi:hypothetical protein